ncbi:hypothetical protein SAMN05192573_110147 [Mucilaginibacter gossypii]|uniref:Uncharacterized protein n=1 Tax=Mucilaginibacter gossypii TaxID=551996 RepID=A0A1G8D7J4_9SPHI|nr:hypothetical protein SAMN05192573_110147 [Mucilaginibacter gossypii]
MVGGLAVPSGRGRSAIPCVHIRYAFQSSRSAYASLAFCKHPHLNTAGCRTRLCGKKYYPGAQRRGWRFFSSKPAGPGLGRQHDVQKFACEKARGGNLDNLKSA